jgi:hypothetical protein
VRGKPRVRVHAARIAILAGAAAAVAAVASTGVDSRGGAQHVEHLRYRATWNTVPVANAELLIQPQPGSGRATSVLLRGRAETNEALDLLWQMRDSFEATVGLAPIAPGRFVLRQNENDHRRETTIVASPSRLVGTVERRHRRTRRADVARAARLYDPASLAYLIRTLPPELEQRASYAVLVGTKIYDLTIAPGGADNVDAAARVWPARRFHLALHLQPKDVESTGGVVIDSTGARRDDQPQRELEVEEADLWISTGPERLPLRLSSSTFWGWVTVELVGRGAPPSA